MRSFESVLRDVERRRREPAVRTLHRLPLAPDMTCDDAVSHRCGRDAYADEPRAKPPDLRSMLFGELASAQDSRSRLRRLRRRCAHALHPDRAANADAASLLAELNAGIDAALKELAG